MRVRFNHTYYRVSFERVRGDPDAWGELDEKGKVIRLNPEMRDRPDKLLGTLIHEGLHAEFPWLDEDAVLQAGYNLEKLLLRLLSVEYLDDGG